MPALYFAPMEGFTDAVYRQAHHRLFPGMRKYFMPFISPSASRSFTLGAFGRVPAMCALDLSESDDFSAVSFGIYRQAERSFWFHTRYYFPEGAMDFYLKRSLWIDASPNTLQNENLTLEDVLMELFKAMRSY